MAGEKKLTARTPWGTFTRRTVRPYTHVAVGLRPVELVADHKNVVFSISEGLAQEHAKNMARRGMETCVVAISAKKPKIVWVVKSVYPEGTQTIAYAEVLRLESTEEIPDSHRLPDGTDIYFDIYPGARQAKEAAQEVNRCYA